MKIHTEYIYIRANMHAMWEAIDKKRPHSKITNGNRQRVVYTKHGHHYRNKDNG